MSADEVRARYATALEPAQPFTDRLVDAMVAARDEEMERLRAEVKTLSRLVETALNIRMYGERAPGGNENWRDWDRAASAYLFPKPPGGDA
jgi:hypothetical protein